MDTLRYMGWVIAYDAASTASIQSQIIPKGVETCNCDYCRNFIAAHTKLYSPEVRIFFNTLGLPDGLFEVEMMQVEQIKPGLHLYLGWTHFVGKILRKPRSLPRLFRKKFAPQVFEAVFSEKADIISPLFTHYPIVQLNFSVQVPWVIDAEEPE